MDIIKEEIIKKFNPCLLCGAPCRKKFCSKNCSTKYRYKNNTSRNEIRKQKILSGEIINVS